EAACWTYIGKKLNLYIYGFYPEDHYWRIHLTFALVAVFFFIPRLFKNNPHRFKLIAFLFISYPILAFYLLYGGIGLEVVETHKWGGLTLTIIIAAVGIVASFPIGVLMALGRQSKMKVIRFFSVLYIEFIRGVPLITILFMASVVLPLFFSEGIDVDKLLRALIGITLFQAAYIAEVIRGGLQAIPRGQYEAADAMGLSFFQKTSLIILPQALKISIPNIVGSFISLFKDTTLVLIIGLFDMLAIVGLSTSDVNWLGRETEGYVFVAFVLWIILYSMSKYSKNIEKRYNTELDKEKL
ncbi:amino acid ABC transporter permease, partial [Gammaproteobacteria bacterium]|nr:amino acid ABC transporter permease [Gammaproteobacteria bacterium]